MSDTPISDSTPHNIAELGMLCRRLERLAAVRLGYIQQLEEQLMDAKDKHAVLVADVVLNEDRAERIKRLEEAGDYLCAAAAFMGWHDKIETWNKAKEAKL
jgi:hypothetical protein